jgi:two-component system, NarL family, sensor histidine kinase DesK
MDVDADVAPVNPAEAQWVASQRRWGQGWRRFAMTGLPAVYLVYLVPAVEQNSRGSGQAAGYAIAAAFAACWLAVPLLLSEATVENCCGRFWPYYGVLSALFLAELPFARAAAFVMCVFLAILAVARLGVWSAPLVAGFAVAALVVPIVVTSWHVSLAKSFDDVTPVAIPIAALITFAVLQVLRGNQALTEARAELALLAAENERIRIARDLHDLLGHSLTTITVKAGLAGRLGAADQASAALREIGEVETLARQTLTDMRAAVTNYRDVTLAAELAAGRELLRAAGVAGELPRAVDVVEPAHQELFGWVVREGVTNVVRHARASSCEVRLSAAEVEIVDDGIGGTAAAGNGLCGLRERVAAAGGVVEAGPLQPTGWRLRVALPPGEGAQ